MQSYIFHNISISACSVFACSFTASKYFDNPANAYVCVYFCVYLLYVGTERHELTSWMSFDSIFRFFSEVLEAKEDEEAEETSNTVTTRSSSLKNKHQDL